jgi:hypothetical protein
MENSPIRRLIKFKSYLTGTSNILNTRESLILQQKYKTVEAKIRKPKKEKKSKSEETSEEKKAEATPTSEKKSEEEDDDDDDDFEELSDSEWD